jgi:hypothetical protein
MRHVVARRHRRLRIAFGATGIVLVVLALAQLLLPAIAAQRVRSRVARYGAVLGAHVSAFPAIELLWGRADSASVRARALTVPPAQIADLLSSARGVDSLDIAAASLRVGPLTLLDASLRKRGSALYAQGQLSAAQLRTLPGGLEVQPLQSSGGQVQVRASGGLFGLRATVNVLVAPHEGKLVAQPEGVLFGGLARVTLFSDPRLSIETIGFEPTGDSSASPVNGGDGVYRVWLTAKLR